MRETDSGVTFYGVLCVALLWGAIFGVIAFTDILWGADIDDLKAGIDDLRRLQGH